MAEKPKRHIFKKVVNRGWPWVARHPKVIDAGVALVLFVGVISLFSWANNPFDKNWDRDTFYQKYYATAAMWVCGHGWNGVLTEIPQLESFLKLEAGEFDCAAIPENVELREPNYQAVRRFYLFGSVALTWKLSGEISWKVLRPLFGLFCALFTIAMYGVFRLGMNQILALVGTLIVFSLQLQMPAYLRDYGKAPFILFAVFLLGLLVKSSFDPRRLYRIAGLVGLTTGIGLGFRSDVLVAVPLAIATIIFFLPVGLLKELKRKLIAVALFLAAVGVAYAPVLRLGPVEHANSSHVLMLGFSNPVLEMLDLEPSIYDWTPLFSDSWVDFQVKTYGYFELDRAEPIQMLSGSYEDVGKKLLLHTFLSYPADVLARGYAAVLQLVRVPFFCGFVVLLVATLSKRIGLFLLVLTFYLAAYPSLQFHPRHYFHVEFVPFWFIGLALQLAWNSGYRCIATGCQTGLAEIVGRIRRWWHENWRLLLAAPVVLWVSMVIALSLLRGWQDSQLERRFGSLETAEHRRLDFREVALGGPDRIRLVPEDFLQPLPPPPRTDSRVGYLVVDIDATDCPVNSMDLTLRFGPAHKKIYSRTLSLDLATSGTTQIFAPIYARHRSPFGASLFLGVEIPVAGVECVELSSIDDLAKYPPLLLVTLPRDWRSRQLFYSLPESPGWKSVRKDLLRSRHWWKRILVAVFSSGSGPKP